MLVLLTTSWAERRCCGVICRQGIACIASSRAARVELAPVASAQAIGGNAHAVAIAAMPKTTACLESRVPAVIAQRSTAAPRRTDIIGSPQASREQGVGSGEQE